MIDQFFEASTGRLVGGAVLAGLLQSLFVLVVGSWFGIPLGNVSLFLGNFFARDAATAIILGRAILGAMALIWAAAFLLFRRAVALPQTPRGLVYGLTIWLISTVILLPLIGAVPNAVGNTASPGFFGLNFAGWPGSLLSLGAHLVYGWGLTSILR